MKETTMIHACDVERLMKERGADAAISELYHNDAATNWKAVENAAKWELTYILSEIVGPHGYIPVSEMSYTIDCYCDAYELGQAAKELSIPISGRELVKNI